MGLDWTGVQAQKTRLVSELRRSRYTEVLAAYPQLTLIDGQASFQPDGSVRAGGRTWRADRYLVATG